MSGNTFGKQFSIHTFGESHGAGIGVVIEGCPAGLVLDLDLIQYDLDRRRPGQSKLTTQRKEGDRAELLSGTFEGKTTGMPIAIFIANENQKTADYAHLKDVFRPSHADYTYQAKYGIRDYRGGGRSSARETAARVAAGSIAKQLLKALARVEISAYVSQVGHIKVEKSYLELDLSKTEANAVRCPDADYAERMANLIDEVRLARDTIGGKITCVCQGVPAGWGEPVFDKLHAELGKAMLSINAAKGFQIGSGFDSLGMRGSEHNDIFSTDDKGRITTLSNHSGGIQGGISNGGDIYFDVVFKPVATIMQDQLSIDSAGNETVVEGKGRHDPCVLPRAVPIVEAMAALVLADFMLRNRNSRLNF